MRIDIYLYINLTYKKKLRNFGENNVVVGDASVVINLITQNINQPRWLSGLRRSRVRLLMIARRSLCPEKLGSNPGQGSKGINLSG